jgi:creatinine amidohydrolase
MRLDTSTWLEVEAYLKHSQGIIIPAGSTEQHGPMGLIGTDAICAGEIANGAGTRSGALVAPVLCYTPAPFNMAFPGSVSISEPLFESMVSEIVSSLVSQGFERIYFLNGHGANILPLQRATAGFGPRAIRIRSWWDFPQVNELRVEYFGGWEGMHATPSEISITQATHRTIPPGTAASPPEKLTPAYMKAHSGDCHGSPAQHRQKFPDGRVGSHSALAAPEYGRAILDAAIASVAEDFLQWNE